MRKKLFTFLLALVTSVGMSWATDPIVIVTNTSQSSYTQGTITITCSKPGDSEGFYLEKDGNETATITNSGSSTISQIELGIGWFPDDRSYVRANGAEPTSSDPYSITFSNVNSNNVTLTITDNKIQIRDVTITLADEGGSAQAGLQVTELQVLDSWEDNPTMLSTSDMPGFVAITKAEAQAWDAAPAGNVVLIFAFEENAATSLYFKNGVCQPTQAYNITYEDLYAWYLNGDKIFYTGGGSTPATGLQVVEVTSDIYNGWNSNGNTFSVNALPGFQAVTYDEAKEWTEVPTSGTAVLVYRTNGDYARVIHFFDGNITGDYDIETDFNQIYENITIFGNRIFYTAGGSTPTPTTSGSCGANVTWEFDPSTGALTITGTGAMDDYLNNASTPWNSYIADITSVTITDGVTNVGNHSFEQCTSLTTVTIGDDVETIGTFAFSECGDQFTTLTLGNSIRTIGNQAFASNRGITGFTLPSTLETIGNYAFIHNNAITTLTIPSNVTSIDVDAFYDWTAVTDVYCYPNAADLTWDDGDCDDFKSGKATICHVNADQLDAYQTKFNDLVRVTFVGDLDAPAPASNPHGECGAQGDNLLWELNTSTGVLTITGSGAMYDWTSDTDRPWYSLRAQITSVVLPSGITSLGKYAFRGTDIVSINMTENYPAGLTTINQEAFFSTQLTSVTIPESVVTIGMDAFRESKTITDVYCYADPNNLTWNDYYCDDFKNADHATVCHVKACALSTYEANWGGTPYNVYNSTGVNVTFVGDLPGDCGASTPTDEQVATNADPENPSYHYSTFFHSTQNYKLSNDGTQAFIADLSNNELVLTEIAHGEQVIPANTAVILRKAGSADPVVLVPTEENGVSVNPDDNSLEGVDVATPVADIAGLTVDNCYVLSGTVQYGVGFYKINGNTLKAHKAYVKFTGGPNNAPKKMRFVFNQEQTATGVESIQSSAISGQKLIENGQLIIIKNGVRYNAQGQIVK